jgi:hypothetical protein
LSDSRLASNLVIPEAYSLPWEDDLSASPSSSDWEASDSGVVDFVDLPMLKVTLAKVVRGSPQAKSAWNSSPAKSLIRWGFLGLRVAPPMVLDDVLLTPATALIRRGFLGSCRVPLALLAVKGFVSLSDGAAELGRSLSQPVSSTSFASKSQLGYSWRVKEKVAKQLNKNKEMLAEVVVVNPGEGVEGYSKEGLSGMNVAPVVGMFWGRDDKKLLDLLSARDRREWKAKGMRELKNLDCSISLVKCQRRRGVVGSKNAFSFPPEVH